MNKDEILQALEDGYKEFSSGRTNEAAGIWLPAWKAAQDHLRQCKNEEEILNLFGETFLNWFFDFDIALMESDMHNDRLDFNRYLLAIPDYMDQNNPRMNVAESLAALNRYDEAESLLSGWLEEDPLWTFGWTCWANIFLDNGKKEKAQEIIERGMTTIESSTEPVDVELFYQNAEAIYRRLGATERADYCARKNQEQLSKANPKQIPIISSKVGSNDPCPCGSGKKYKKCCGR
jgi:tetratricopeptide (TPR) repeat protein